MSEDAQLIDSNVLIRWVKQDDHSYSLVNKAIRRLLEKGTVLCYTSQNLSEFWNACTRPMNRNGFGLSIKETDSRARVIESNLNLLPDSLAVHLEWRRIIVAYSVSGVQVHDARLVAVMRVHSVNKILTFNQSDFVRYASIEAVHPKMLS
jgi:predicted nucleic acid-binding protein